jgi:hypothetical protein
MLYLIVYLTFYQQMEPYGRIPVSIMHRLLYKVCVDVKNGRLKAIKLALSLSRHPVHNVMFKVGFFYFRSVTTTKPIIKEVVEQPMPTNACA